MPPGDSSLIFRRRYAALNRSALRDFVAILTSRIAKGRPFDTLITGDDELQSLNRRFRKKDKPTDVLSFSAGVPELLGELAVSYDRARDQARAMGHSIQQEVCVLILHGALHLAGMDHETDHGEMARAEARWRRKLDLPAGLIARTAP